MEEGRYFLPGSATGLRETIITSPVRAEPQYLQIMPGPSVWPFLSAVFTAGFFLLLTVQAYGVGMASGVLAILSVLRWLWETDRPVLAGWSRTALRRRGGRKRLSVWLLILSALLLLGALIADHGSWYAAGLRPDASGQGATVFAFLGLQACLVGVCVLMAAFVAARGARGFVAVPRSNVIDLPAIFLIFTAAAGATSAALARLVPGPF